MNSPLLDLEKSVALARDFWLQLKQKAIQRRFPDAADYFGRLDSEPSVAWSRLLYDAEMPIANVEEFDRLLSLERSCLEGSEYIKGSTLVEAFGPCPDYMYPPLNHDSNGLLNALLDQIGRTWPHAHREFLAFVRGSFWFHSPECRSFSKPGWFGAVFVSNDLAEPGASFQVATSLIHEVGHLMMFAMISRENPLHDPTKKIYSPFKKTDRPAIAVLHAQVALARMIMWITVCSEKGTLGEYKDSHLIERWYDEFSRDFKDGFKILNSERFSKSGEQLMHDFSLIEKGI